MPPVALAVKTEEVATPEALVVAVVVIVKLANSPLAPLLGAVNVTTTLGTTLPPESFTVATSRLPKGLLMLVVCPLPVVAAIDAAAPTVLVSE